MVVWEAEKCVSREYQISNYVAWIGLGDHKHGDKVENNFVSPQDILPSAMNTNKSKYSYSSWFWDPIFP